MSHDFWILFGIGVATAVGGILLLKRERRMFAEAVQVPAIVSGYEEYLDRSNSDGIPLIMYTMTVDYVLLDGTKIHAKEQSSASWKKHPVGADLTISYSPEKPDFFTLAGDRSRSRIMSGMIVVGSTMTAGAVYLALSGRL
jgi:hypothetical protein